MRFFRFHAAERRFLTEAFRAILPPETAAVPLDGFFGLLVARAPLQVLWGLRIVCYMIRLNALLRGRPWSRRTVSQRIELLDSLRRSEVHLFREAPTMLKALAGFAGFGHPAGQRAFGLPVDATPPAWSVGGDP